jgi:ligand-binding sensor domain-containing protein/signal transduction histidine kinase
MECGIPVVYCTLQVSSLRMLLSSKPSSLAQLRTIEGTASPLPRSRGIPAKAWRWRLAFALVSALPLWAAAPSGASPQAFSQAQYTRRVWHIQDGLPEETVQAIRQTDDGYLWIGTTGGLVRFDGSRFIRSLQPWNHTALTDDSTFCILTAHDGSLWLGTEGEGLLHLKSGDFRAYTAADGLTDGFVRSVMEDRQERVWIGTDNGLFRMVHGKIEPIDTSPYAPLAVHAIFEDREQRIWVGGSQLLAFSAEGMTRYKLPGAFSQNRVKSVYQTGDGTLWVGTVGGLSRLVNGRFEAVPEITGTVRTLTQTTDGTLWIGMIGHGLYTYKNGVFARISGNGLLPSKTVLSIVEDKSQQVWIGTQDGLVRLNRTPVSVTPLPGGSDPDYQTISYDSDGTIWAIASSVYTIRDGVARLHRFAGMPNVPIRNIYRDHLGTLWIGTDGSGAYHLTPSGTIHYSAPERLVNNFVRAFLQTDDRSMWIATDEGVSRISGEHVQNLGVRNGLAYFSTRALVEDRDSGVWIGTDHGLSHWRAGTFLQDAATEGLRDEKVWSILQDHNGDLWFGTRDHGLFRYRSGKLTQYTTAQGLASNSIYQILEDRRGELWLSGPNTISSFNIAGLGVPSLQKPSFLGVTVYDMPWGADGAQMYGGRQPAGCLGSDGGVWFPSNKGAVHVMPEDPQAYAAPSILITNAVSDGRQLALGSPLVLPANTSRLEIAFALLMLRPQEGIRFRYRLESFDRDWTYAQASHEATYTNLPAGKYNFHIVAFEVNHPELTSEVSLKITKNPHFYDTWWFFSLCLLALAMLAWVIYRSRMRMVRVRFKAVLEERSRLAREMHDTVIQGCTSVSALLEAVSSLERVNQTLEQDLLNHARTQVRTTIDEAREAVWNLRHDEEPAQDLYTLIAGVAEHTRKEFNVRVECTISGRPLAMQAWIARELLMVVREAVYNAALHARPRSIAVDLTYQHDELLLAVVDDGTGFNPEAPSNGDQRHYGIAGMQERMERLHGSVELTSADGRGTKLLVRISRTRLLAAAARVSMKF